MKDALSEHIIADPAFAQWKRRRGRFNGILTSIMLITFYGFIGAIAFRPDLLAIPLSTTTVISYGVLVGFSIIVLALFLIGLYVVQSNRDFDPEIAAIVARAQAATSKD